MFFNKPLKILGFDEKQREIVKQLMLGISLTPDKIRGRNVIRIIELLSRRSIREAIEETLHILFKIISHQI